MAEWGNRIRNTWSVINKAITLTSWRIHKSTYQKHKIMWAKMAIFRKVCVCVFNHGSPILYMCVCVCVCVCLSYSPCLLLVSWHCQLLPYEVSSELIITDVQIRLRPLTHYTQGKQGHNLLTYIPYLLAARWTGTTHERRPIQIIFARPRIRTMNLLLVRRGVSVCVCVRAYICYESWEIVYATPWCRMHIHHKK